MLVTEMFLQQYLICVAITSENGLSKPIICKILWDVNGMYSYFYLTEIEMHFERK